MNHICITCADLHFQVIHQADGQMMAETEKQKSGGDGEGEKERRKSSDKLLSWEAIRRILLLVTKDRREGNIKKQK